MAIPSASDSTTQTPHTYLLTLWVEQQAEQEWVWRGVLQRPDGTRMYFRTLATLNDLVREWGGWQEPSDGSRPPSP